MTLETKAELWEDAIVRLAERLEKQAAGIEKTNPEGASTIRYVKHILYGYCGMSSWQKAEALVLGTLFEHGEEVAWLKKVELTAHTVSVMRQTGLVE